MARWALAAAVTPALVLGVTACAGEGGGADAPQGAAAIALPFEPVASLSPFSDDALLSTRMGVAETLVRLDSDGVATPWLAESVERPDGKTAVFTLREGVKFQDGTPMTGEAVVRSLQAAFDAASRPKGLGKKQLTFAADGNTVTVTSEVDDPVLVQRFADAGTVILSAAAYEADPSTPDVVGHATGPYTLTSVSTSKATAEAFADYWGGAPEITTLNVDFLTDGGARTNALRGGEVNLAQAVPIAQLSSLGDVELESTPIPRGVYLHLNTAKGAFAKESVRAAAAKAISPKEIVDAVYEGHAGVAEGSLFVPDTAWAKGAGSHNTTEGAADAAALGAEPIVLATWVERPELGEVASLVADQLRSAGFEVTVRVSDYNSIEKALLDGEFDAVIGSRNYQLGAADPVSFLQSDYSCEGSYNLSQFCDADIDAQIAAAAEKSDMEDRFRSAAAIGAEIVGRNAVIPLAHEYSLIAYDGVEGVSFDPFERTLIVRDTHRTN
ncbi:ABC transporter substrate-binding protein [Corynebacterium sp. 13CS0277]|nr:ABC transporter substrate-binding protein [Corynebacterium sp. 13CS0277]